MIQQLLHWLYCLNCCVCAYTVIDWICAGHRNIYSSLSFNKHERYFYLKLCNKYIMEYFLILLSDLFVGVILY